GLVVMRAVESNYGEDKSREPTFKPRLKPRGTVMQITSSFFYPPAQHFCIPIIHLRTHAAGIVKKKDVCVFVVVSVAVSVCGCCCVRVKPHVCVWLRECGYEFILSAFRFKSLMLLWYTNTPL